MKSKKLQTLEWTPELAKRFWDDLAGTEFQAQTAFSRWASAYLVDLVKSHIPPRSKILDFGSGYSLYLARELLTRGYDVAYLEPSVPAEERDHELDNLPNFLGPARVTLPGQYDVAFFSEVIEHLPDEDLNVALLSLRTTLKSSGVLIVTTPDSENLFLASRYCPTCRHLFHPWGHVRSFSARELEDLLLQHGFKVIELHSVDFSSNRESLEELKKLKELLPHVLSEVEAAADVLAVTNPESALRLKSQLESIKDYRQPGPPRDPRRLHIGAGGTLVAVAKKDGLSE